MLCVAMGVVWLPRNSRKLANDHLTNNIYDLSECQEYETELLFDVIKI